MSIQLILKVLLCYYAAINIFLFAAMGYDKHCAVKKKWRVPEATLFIIALLGGGLGGLIGIKAFHHKTKKPMFYVVFILSIILHIALIYFSSGFFGFQFLIK